MGSLGGRAAQVYRARFGAAKWKEHVRGVGGLWRGIQERLVSLKLDFSRLRLYQDGLPVCGKEAEIVRDLAARGSPNHQLIAGLMDLGARLEGTEDVELLLREYELAKCQLAQVHGRAAGGGQAVEDAQTILRERDYFIARRIGETLGGNETGLLFLGLAHEVPSYLPQDIAVQFLIHRLPFKKYAEPVCISHPVYRKARP